MADEAQKIRRVTDVHAGQVPWTREERLGGWAA
jgi:hypothetical protein